MWTINPTTTLYIMYAMAAIGHLWQPLIVHIDVAHTHMLSAPWSDRIVMLPILTC